MCSTLHRTRVDMVWPHWKVKWLIQENKEDELCIFNQQTYSFTFPSEFAFAQRQTQVLLLDFATVLNSLGVGSDSTKYFGWQTSTDPMSWMVHLPPARLQFFLLRHCRSPETESILLSLLDFRLPGPTARVSAAGSEAKTRGGSATANNRRSQSFNNYDKSKPVTSPLPPPPPNSHEKGKSTSWGSFLTSSFTADPVPFGELGQGWEWVVNKMDYRTYWLAGTLLAEALRRWGKYIPSC